MKCLQCNKTHFVKKKVRFNPEIKRKTLEVIALCMVCKNCQAQLMTTKQMSVFIRACTHKYKENDVQKE